jgi:hypothetical protein
MATIEITYEAKCKHCKYLKEDYLGKRKLHKCKNKNSWHFGYYRRLKDKACKNIELK